MENNIIIERFRVKPRVYTLELIPNRLRYQTEQNYSFLVITKRLRPQYERNSLKWSMKRGKWK